MSDESKLKQKVEKVFLCPNKLQQQFNRRLYAAAEGFPSSIILSRAQMHEERRVQISETEELFNLHRLRPFGSVSNWASCRFPFSPFRDAFRCGAAGRSHGGGRPNAAAEGSQPAPPEGSADAAPAATAGAKAAEALLPSLSIWPPSQRTRDAVVRRLVQTLAAPSILSERYGAVPEPEAERAAAAAEAEAFAAASKSAAAESPASVEEGIEVLQAYSKEVSRRLLELAKSRSAAAAAAPAEGARRRSPRRTRRRLLQPPRRLP
ncbi:unnamed protein product [Miscanthus lutarioriparius]|uniref:WPP domain-containing protein n=1 Tax=Miscanthus lutarioriparius TaxID=422564 RepID=A0A811NIJ6_9POAL|nr:unnamed protein product [Miscanthus lutarioriparius]